ncbi:LysR family transcriptional regulator [Allorhizobium borbori]|uniref:DNA-binding transcriptional LysR family regulator n=1 Tax=Allorhizobium borbori TaxID=485907 RepID=A0A7W6K3F9_9HYPH|nr:LysR family transcriptional regulator [Allorhizobium borbori]MBB4103352.1 DNA-binding transcriptional LysR family regulator [Allorhizobium borbori]
MNIRFLETMIWLSELKNFRVTAERMNMTPAAISNRIAAMEQELGVKLFERDTREVRLTQEGVAFVEGARDIVARYGRLVTSVSPTTAIEGAVKIGLLPSMALTLLPGIMEVLKRKFPRVRVAITTDSSTVLLDKLESRELDVVLGFPGQPRENLRVMMLCTFGMFWIANGEIDPGDEVMTRQDILQFPIISYEAGAHNHRRMIDYLPPNSFDETVVHYSNSLATTVSMIAAGVGISVLPPIVIQNELRAGTLRVLNVKPAFPSTDYFAIYLENPSSRLSPLVASIALDVASRFCALYDNALAARPENSSPAG